MCRCLLIHAYDIDKASNRVFLASSTLPEAKNQTILCSLVTEECNRIEELRTFSFTNENKSNRSGIALPSSLKYKYMLFIASRSAHPRKKLYNQSMQNCVLYQMSDTIFRRLANIENTLAMHGMLLSKQQYVTEY